MANALQCDRCKQFYTKNTIHPTQERIKGEVQGGIAINDEQGSPDIWFDLCDDCLTKLKIFMEGKNE